MEELDLMQIVKYLWKEKDKLAYLLLVCLIVGVIYTFGIKGSTYTTTAKILIDKADTTISDYIMSSDILTNKDIKATFDKATKLITISTTTKNAEETYRITTEYIANLEEKLESTYNVEEFKTIEEAKLPTEAKNTYIKDMGISLAIGAVIYFAYIMVILMKRGISNSRELENITGINVLGEVRLEDIKNKEKSNGIVISKNNSVPYNTENSNIINDLKRIESKIEFNKDNKKPKTIVFTAAKTNAGTTYIVNNLASQYAKIYKKVLLVDTDIFTKKLTGIFDKEEEKGLTNALESNKENIEKLVQKTDRDNIYILPVGNKEIEEDIFMKEKIAEVIKKLSEVYDLVLIDTTSINEHIIPIQLTSIADATVIVMESGKTSEDLIIKAKNTIEKVDGKISGIIMNKIW